MQTEAHDALTCQQELIFLAHLVVSEVSETHTGMHTQTISKLTFLQTHHYALELCLCVSLSSFRRYDCEVALFEDETSDSTFLVRIFI